MEEQNNLQDWIQTYTGKKFDILNPKEEMICVEDIAASLSKICRYNGHCIRFYSVAEHSCLLAQYVYSTTFSAQRALEALFHDASEAYFCDLPRPFKYNLPLYREFEIKLDKIIMDKFNLTYPMSEWLKNLDTRMLKTEKDVLMTTPPEKWFCDDYEPLIIDIKENRINWQNEFIRLYNIYNTMRGNL